MGSAGSIGGGWTGVVSATAVLVSVSGSSSIINYGGFVETKGVQKGLDESTQQQDIQQVARPGCKVPAQTAANAQAPGATTRLPSESRLLAPGGDPWRHLEQAADQHIQPPKIRPQNRHDHQQENA